MNFFYFMVYLNGKQEIRLILTLTNMCCLGARKITSTTFSLRFEHAFIEKIHGIHLLSFTVSVVGMPSIYIRFSLLGSRESFNHIDVSGSIQLG